MTLEAFEMEEEEEEEVEVEAFDVVEGSEDIATGFEGETIG